MVLGNTLQGGQWAFTQFSLLVLIFLLLLLLLKKKKEKQAYWADELPTA